MTKEISNKIANLGVIGALMVVLIHLPKCLTAPVSVMYKILPDGLLGSAVMMFFAISGYLIAGHIEEMGWWRRECKKRVGSLLIPYVMLNFFYLGVMTVYHMVGAGSSEFTLSARGVAAAFGLTGGSPIVGPLWYVRSLLLSILIFPLFTPVVRANRWYVFGLWLLFSFGGLLLPGAIWRPIVRPLGFWGLHSVDGFGFFLVGAALRVHGLPRIPRGVGLVGIVIAFALSLTMVNCENAYICSWLNRSLKAVMVASLWSLAPESKWPKLLTGNSFCVYSLHWMITHPSWLVLDHLGIYDRVFGSFITYFLFPVLIFAAIISFAELVKRHLPKFAAIVFGGR